LLTRIILLLHLKLFRLLYLLLGWLKYLEPYLPSVEINENGHSSLHRKS
jgi:hypothetical protein